MDYTSKPLYVATVFEAGRSEDMCISIFTCTCTCNNEFNLRLANFDTSSVHTGPNPNTSHVTRNAQNSI